MNIFIYKDKPNLDLVGSCVVLKGNYIMCYNFHDKTLVSFDGLYFFIKNSNLFLKTIKINL